MQVVLDQDHAVRGNAQEGLHLSQNIIQVRVRKNVSGADSI
jgi:hypothetical protein